MSDLQSRLSSSIGHAYTFERELGGGGMSRVFVAHETTLGRRVVVKVLPPDMAAEVSHERFEREIALAARLQHPHIVPLHSAGHADGLPYFCMPFVDGETLRSRLERGEMPLTEAVRLLREIASALAYAHEQGVVHRDLKPDNVLLSRGSAMVTDFGVAKALHAATTRSDVATLTSIGMTIGTPSYMSPEQAMASPDIDARSDIYAFGVVAYEIFVGHTPFSGRTAQATIAGHIAEVPEDIARLKPTLPPRLATLITRCLAKNPSDRPSSANEIIAVLDDITAPHTAGSLGTRRGRQAIIAAVVVIIAVAASLFVRTRRASATSDKIDSIAVLPLEAAAGDTTTEWLSEGLTDGLSSELVRQGLRVPSRSMVSAVRARATDPRAIAEQLGVSSVFVWKVSRLGTRLRVSAELDDAKGFTLLQRTVERDGRDLTGLKEEVLRELLTAMRARLAISPTRDATTKRQHTPPPEAVELYIRGIHAFSKGGREGYDEAIRLLNQAVAKDSLYGDAWEALAYTWFSMADAFEPPKKMIPIIQSALGRAAAIDSTPRVHMMIAAMASQYLWEYERAVKEFDRALEMDPQSADGYLFRALALVAFQDCPRITADLKKAVQLDPYNAFNLNWATIFYSQCGLQDEALAIYQKAMAVDSTFMYIEPWGAFAYRAKGDYANAFKLDRRFSTAERPVVGLALDFAATGKLDSARAVMQKLDALRRRGVYVSPEIAALGWLAIGDRDKALDYLDIGAETISAGTAFTAGFAEFKQLRGNPRYERHLERTHLKPYMH